MEWPDGLLQLGLVTSDEMDGTCLRLARAMYGTVQAPLAFFNELAKYLVSIGMIQSTADPCVWYRRTKDGQVSPLVVVVYVDDLLYTGTADSRSWFKEQIKTRFNIVDLGKLSKHLGVWYSKNSDEKCQNIKLRSLRRLGGDYGQETEACGDPRLPRRESSPRS
jgi:Reverse transcriptase (RNA-dependent DNA polymerase)